MKTGTKILIGGGIGLFLLWWFCPRRKKGLPEGTPMSPVLPGYDPAAAATGETPAGSADSSSGYYPVGTPGVDTPAASEARQPSQIALEAPATYATSTTAATDSARRAEKNETLVGPLVRSCPPNYALQNGECVPIV